MRGPEPPEGRGPRRRRDGSRHLEAAAAEVANIANEGDKRIQAIRQRLAKAGHTHNTDVETKADYMFVTNREKKGLLDLAGRIGRAGATPRPPTWRPSAPSSPTCSRRRSPPSEPARPDAGRPPGPPPCRRGPETRSRPCDSRRILARPSLACASASCGRRPGRPRQPSRTAPGRPTATGPPRRPALRRRGRGGRADDGPLLRRAGQGPHPRIGRHRLRRSSTTTATAGSTSTSSTPGPSTRSRRASGSRAAMRSTATGATARSRT